MRVSINYGRSSSGQGNISFEDAILSASRNDKDVENSEKTVFYTGVGSRSTPRDVAVLMCALAIELRNRGWLLRSGAADGADLAFESGAGSQKHIFLPYPGFNGSDSTRNRIPAQAMERAQAIHPAWHRCSDFAKKAHARNVLQVFGERLDEPSSMLVCWTEGGVPKGGTRTAILLAEQAGVPVFNLGSPQIEQQVRQWVGKEALELAEKAVWLNAQERDEKMRMSAANEAKEVASRPAARGFRRLAR